MLYKYNKCSFHSVLLNSKSLIKKFCNILLVAFMINTNISLPALRIQALKHYFWTTLPNPNTTNNLAAPPAKRARHHTRKVPQTLLRKTVRPNRGRNGKLMFLNHSYYTSPPTSSLTRHVWPEKSSSWLSGRQRRRIYCHSQNLPVFGQSLL